MFQSKTRLFFIALAFIMSFSFIGCEKDDSVDLTAPTEAAETKKIMPPQDVRITAPAPTKVLFSSTINEDYYDNGDYYDGDYYDGDYYDDDYYDDEYYDDEYYEDYYDDDYYDDYDNGYRGNSNVIVAAEEIVTSLAKPNPVYIYFNYDYNYDYEPLAIDLKNEDIADLVTISPAIEGEWWKSGGGTIIFRPTNDWPADQEYKITFKKGLFNENYKLKNYNHKFSTQPFKATLHSFSIYQIPAEVGGLMSKPYAIATLEFNYPVNSATLEKGITLTHDGKKISFTVTYDNVKRYAYLKSEDITIQEKTGMLKLSISSATTDTGVSLKEGVANAIDVPSMSDFFKVNNVYTNVIRNIDNNEPEQIITFDFTLPVSIQELKKNVVVYKLPRKYNNSYNYDWRYHNKEITEDEYSKFEKVNLDFLTETSMENIQAAKYLIYNDEDVQLGIRIKKGIKSTNQFVLNKDYFKVYYVPRLPIELKFTQDGRILTLKGDKSLTFVSRNVGKVKIEIAKIEDSRINHLLSQLYGDIKYANFKGYDFNEYDISTLYNKTITLNNTNPSKLNYFNFNLSEYFDKTGNAGVFIIKTMYYDANGYTNTTDKRLIQITDMGLIVKKNADDTRNVYVISMKDGTPIKGANVSYLTRNGKLNNKSTTNSDGFAIMPPSKGSNENEVVAIFVENGKDYTFMTINKLSPISYSRFDVGGEYPVSPQSGYVGIKNYSFTDRGIYRPGDTVHIGLISKQDNWQSLSGVPMQLTVTNPRGQKVLTHKFTMNESGFSEVDFQTDYTSPTGVYEMSFDVIKDDKIKWSARQIGTRTFKVQEFKPDTMKINARIDGPALKGWMPLENLKLEVTLNNLYGIPAQNRNIKWKYQVFPASFSFKEYSQFIFTDPYREGYRHFNPVNLSDATTDEKGKAVTNLDLSQYAGGLYSVMAQVEGFEAGSGDSVVTTVEKLISPLEYLVGYKSDSKLRYIKRNTEQKVQFIAINPNLDKIALDNLKYSIVEKKYVTLLVKQNNGTYVYQSVLRDNVIKADKYSISKDGSSFSLPTDAPGTYQLQIKDKKDMLVAKVDYFVAGDSNLTLSMEKNIELNLKLDKGEYKPGDDIEINIITPYIGSGIITIEQDKVYAAKMFKTTTTSTKQKIRLPEGLSGNGYINVSFFRDPTSQDVFTTPYTYAAVPFSISKSKHEISVSLEVPEEVLPGKPLHISYMADKKSKIVIFAVDEGILQVANYSTPNPLPEFFRKKALQVSTYQILDMLLSDGKAVLEAAGVGGDYEGLYEMASSKSAARAALSANLNPFKRKTEVPIAYWSGIIDAEPNKPNTVTYNVPAYFNGTLRVMAVAVSTEAAGMKDQKMLVRAPIIVQPSMPVNFAPGDKAGISVTIANNIIGSKADTPIEVTVSSNEYFEIVGNKTQTLNLSEGAEGRVDFEVKATGKLGSGTVTFNAKAPSVKGSEVSIDSTASVRPATAYSTVITTGVSERKDVVLKDFGRDMYPELAERSVTASHNPLLIARGLSAYLVKYPHGCTEQITSQSFPGIYVRGSFVTEKEAQEAFERTVNMLRARQTSSGGFTLWQGGWSYVHEFATVYAMHFLTDAKAQGYHVPNDLMDNGLKWLQSYTKIDNNNKVNGLYDAQMKAYAAYVLTRNGVVTTAFMSNLEDYLNKNHSKEWKSSVTGAYMAAIYKMLKIDDKANDLIRSFVPDVKNRFAFYSDFDSSTLRNTQYLYLLGKHFSSEIGKIDVKIILNLLDSITDQHYSSILSSYSILALYSLADATKGEDKNMKIILDTVNKKNVELKYIEKPYPYAEFTEKPLKITAETPQAGKMGFFMVATEQGFDLNVPDKETKGIEVSREYFDTNGKVKTTFKQGDDVIVKLKVRSNGSLKYIENVVLIDLLPASLEVQSNAISEIQRMAYSGSYSSRSIDYIDVREDRLIFYMPLSTSAKEITYKAKVVSRGEFTIPPAYASAMYDPIYRGNTAGGKMIVTEK